MGSLFSIASAIVLAVTSPTTSALRIGSTPPVLLRSNYRRSLQNDTSSPTCTVQNLTISFDTYIPSGESVSTPCPELELSVTQEGECVTCTITSFSSEIQQVTLVYTYITTKDDGEAAPSATYCGSYIEKLDCEVGYITSEIQQLTMTHADLSVPMNSLKHTAGSAPSSSSDGAVLAGVVGGSLAVALGGGEAQ